MHSSLRNLDLNLLLVFDAIYRHRSVVAAADELAMSPSACSHALTRLRQALADELFVRYGSAMQPTVQAERMADDVSAALSLLGTRLSQRGHFEPARSDETFILAVTDFTAFSLLPLLLRRLEGLAPHIRVRVVYSTQQDALEELAAGRVHFSLGFTHDAQARVEELEAIDCYADDYVVLASASHPRLNDGLSLAGYLAERHVVVLPWKDSTSIIDQALSAHAVRRDVAVELPSMMAAPAIVSHTDYLATLPRRAVRHFVRGESLRYFEAPFVTPVCYLKAFFHPRYAAGASHRWLRERIAETFAETGAGLQDESRIPPI
ncbi:LysR family transcriptional regulator [Pseudomonas japonica]|uniref:DNA-binding transcriptional regulator, LysR family n=1 Tax=Pseudomonas japonica TaxID=256466 RepID=A0A239CXM8_9PSED|nr:LysR family transcriptional regulator [Pseudomonas japonica]SNS24860.1 DNA-binding transcriptional regulator, LysR family [Pseudomonas japonica]